MSDFAPDIRSSEDGLLSFIEALLLSFLHSDWFLSMINAATADMLNMFCEGEKRLQIKSEILPC